MWTEEGGEKKKEGVLVTLQYPFGEGRKEDKRRCIPPLLGKERRKKERPMHLDLSKNKGGEEGEMRECSKNLLIINTTFSSKKRKVKKRRNQVGWVSKGGRKKALSLLRFLLFGRRRVRKGKKGRRLDSLPLNGEKKEEGKKRTRRGPPTLPPYTNLHRSNKKKVKKEKEDNESCVEGKKGRGGELFATHLFSIPPVKKRKKEEKSSRPAAENNGKKGGNKDHFFSFHISNLRKGKRAMIGAFPGGRKKGEEGEGMAVSAFFILYLLWHKDG